MHKEHKYICWAKEKKNKAIAKVVMHGQKLRLTFQLLLWKRL